MTFVSLKWAVAETEYNHHVLLIRFRQFPPSFLKSKYPERLNIFWTMAESDANGLPTDNEFERLESFENRLLDAVEHDEHSILAVVITCNGEKEFVFHTPDVPGFMMRLTNMPQEVNRYPITIQRNYDHDWSYFESVIPNPS